MKREPQHPKDDVELMSAGFGALMEKLGPSGAIRFVKLCEASTTIKDYTKERHRWLDKLTFEDIAESARQRGADRGFESSAPATKPKARRTAATRPNPKAKEGRA